MIVNRGKSLHTPAIAWFVSGALVLAAAGVAGYLLGKGAAPDEAESRQANEQSFHVGYAKALSAARRRSLKVGLGKGRTFGRHQGASLGSRGGSANGEEAAEVELARIKEEKVAAEAAAEEAAELAIPAPCRGLPDSTARRMCIGAVEAGTYP